MMRDAYYSSHTRKTIEASFRRSGLWPFNPERLLSAPLALSTNEMDVIFPRSTSSFVQVPQACYIYFIINNKLLNCCQMHRDVLCCDGCMAFALLRAWFNKCNLISVSFHETADIAPSRDTLFKKVELH